MVYLRRFHSINQALWKDTNAFKSVTLKVAAFLAHDSSLLLYFASRGLSYHRSRISASLIPQLPVAEQAKFWKSAGGDVEAPSFLTEWSLYFGRSVLRILGS